jgi:cell wall-associated NlpC family hydrolase
MFVIAVGGTANSSEAARKKAGSKNHSTKVNKETKQGKAKQSVIAYRHARASARPVASQSGFGTQRSWSVAEKRSHQAANAGYDRSGAVETPRAATGSENTRESFKTSQGATADAAVLEALARRKAWADPRRSLLEPVKVQDPAVVEREAPVVAKAVAAVARVNVDRPGVQMDRQASVAAGSYNEDLIREALRNRGKPYVWGGASRGGFDCSGFMCYIFAQQRGLKLPHSASAQARLGAPVSADALQAGDLVFFSTYRRGISHVGMALGDGRFIHAANTRRDVRIDSLTSGYYANRLKAARRLTRDPVRLSPADLRALTQDASVLPTGEER